MPTTVLDLSRSHLVRGVRCQIDGDVRKRFFRLHPVQLQWDRLCGSRGPLEDLEVDTARREARRLVLFFESQSQFLCPAVRIAANGQPESQVRGADGQAAGV